LSEARIVAEGKEGIRIYRLRSRKRLELIFAEGKEGERFIDCEARRGSS
jgi:hypothetical protein